ncbi:hypothetical protein BLA60_37350 [Actinophytocola xinjiangensis]|uniref:Uncharacterized protein n=1 Tax=Actinophytocola xinjiangensis TaxID=485602 RepID=A0A7Z1AU63_9PSEU|nr:DUF6412 domain-containing protein [Actinophytocola xinjiangensis]OLF05210.1 hypothetical protein BLA60_37350 [Actinophytocola xinjiangensis]
MHPTGLRLRLLAAFLLPALLLALPATAHGPLALATALTAGLATAIGVAAVVVVRLAPTVTPASVRTVSLRERARLTSTVRLRDPDAPGRTRPRAPSVRPAA